MFFVFAAKLALAQEPLPDTLSLPEPTGEPIVTDSTVATLLILPSDLEYIPGDDTPELLADRLACLQKQIPLTYNNTIHGFIDFFTVRNREYTRMVQRRQDLFSFFPPDISTATYHIDNPNGGDPTLNMCSIPVDGGRPNSADLQLQ